eukprot:TRINITY_DN10828_c0_g4_i1.p1 TRINITY_DN10828_c0_g4~~TRINITY_DN10828_c0_g4_i1.p1  ORF type:complete len:703 (+),score=111.77 TRINITY_DN10828_c0_g4_i1:45-2153(+)
MAHGSRMPSFSALLPTAERRVRPSPADGDMALKPVLSPVHMQSDVFSRFKQKHDSTLTDVNRILQESYESQLELLRKGFRDAKRNSTNSVKSARSSISTPDGDARCGGDGSLPEPVAQEFVSPPIASEADHAAQLVPLTREASPASTVERPRAPSLLAPDPECERPSIVSVISADVPSGSPSYGAMPNADDCPEMQVAFPEEATAKKGNSLMLESPNSGVCFGRASYAQDDNEPSDPSNSSELAYQELARRPAPRYSQFEARLRAKSVAVGAIDMQRIGSIQRRIVNERRQKVKVIFEGFATALLIANMIMIGLEIEYVGRQTSLPEFLHSNLVFRIADVLFCILFVIELAYRVKMDGIKEYLTNTDWYWNYFDIAVVCLMVVEVVLLIIQENMRAASDDSKSDDALGQITFVGRVVRMLRIARILRVIRVMRFIRPFKLLVQAIYGTLKSCAWAVLLLVLIMYVFAVIFAQSVADYLIANVDDDEDEALVYYFGTLTRAMYTLYKSIFGGVDWQDVSRPLHRVSSFLTLCFGFFIGFTNLAVMNVVTGMFLQNAIFQAQQDQDNLIQMQLREKAAYVKRLKKLFEKFDSSKDGQISLTEFETHLEDDHMKAFLESFEIDTSDAWLLFRLLDTDSGGSIDYEEFVDGCIRLKGNAKCIQVAQLMYHDKWLMDAMCELTETVQEALDGVKANTLQNAQNSVLS